MASKLLLPVVIAGIAIVQVLVPHLTRTYTLFGFSRNYTSYEPRLAELSKTCTLQHPEKLFGCEDLHRVGNSLFAACISDYGNRMKFSPGGRDVIASSGKKPGGDKIFRWDLESDEVVELELRGLEEGGGEVRAFHGMDINELPDGTLSLYVINHRMTGSVVEKFSHTPGTTHLTHLTTITPVGPNSAPHPNDIFSLPHLDSLNAFYITNDFFYASGFLQKFELWARRPWSHVSYYSTATDWKTSLANIPSVNGITGDKRTHAGGKGRVYISSLTGGEIIVAETTTNPGELIKVQTVSLNFLPDNPSLTADGKELYIAGLPNGLTWEAHMASPEEKTGGTVVARLGTGQLGSGFFGGEEGGGRTASPVVEELFVDMEGRLLNSSTTAVVAGGDLFVTGLTGRGILRCKGAAAEKGGLDEDEDEAGVSDEL